jgi:hypothetical protein
MEDIFMLFIFWICAMLGLGLACGWTVHWVWNRYIVPYNWPYIFLLRERRQNGIYPYLDRAKIKTTPEGLVKMFVRNMKINVQPIRFDRILSYGSGGLIDVYSPNRDEFYTTNFNLKKERVLIKIKNAKGEEVEQEVDMDYPQLDIIPDDMKNWYVLSKREAEQRWEKKPGIWEKYGTVIAIGMIFAFTIVGIILGGQYLVQQGAMASSGLRDTTQNMAIIADRLGTIITQLGGSINTTFMNTTAPAGAPAAPNPLNIIPGVNV